MPAKSEDVDLEVVDELDEVADDADLDADDVKDSGTEEPDEDGKYAAGDIPDSQLDATRLYLNEIGFSKLLTAEEEVFYARLAQKGDVAARRRMIECNLRLVVKIARRYMNRGWRCST